MTQGLWSPFANNVRDQADLLLSEHFCGPRVVAGNTVIDARVALVPSRCTKAQRLLEPHHIARGGRIERRHGLEAWRALFGRELLEDRAAGAERAAGGRVGRARKVTVQQDACP